MAIANRHSSCVLVYCRSLIRQQCLVPRNSHIQSVVAGFSTAFSSDILLCEHQILLQSVGPCRFVHNAQGLAGFKHSGPEPGPDPHLGPMWTLNRTGLNGWHG